VWLEATLDDAPLIALDAPPFYWRTDAWTSDVWTEGDHVLVVTARDAAGNVATGETSFAIDWTAPIVTFPGISDGAVFTTAVTPEALVSDDHPGTTVSALLDGVPYMMGTEIAIPGPHILDVFATDAADNTGSGQVSFVLDIALPPSALSLELTEPSHGFVTAGDSFAVIGTARGGVPPYGLTVNGDPATIEATGFFSTRIALPIGPATIQVEATDALGATASATVLGERILDATGGGGAGCPATTLVHDAIGNLTGAFRTCSDANHCGTVGHVCPEGPTEYSATCYRGTCAYTRDGGLVDVMTDPLSCGSVGSICPVPSNGIAACRLGTCEMVCDPGFAPLDGECVEPGGDKLRTIEIVNALVGNMYLEVDRYLTEPAGIYWTPEWATIVPPLTAVRFEGRELGPWTINNRGSPDEYAPVIYPAFTPCLRDEDFRMEGSAYSRREDAVPTQVEFDFGDFQIAANSPPVITAVTSIEGSRLEGTVTFAGRNLDHHLGVDVMDGRSWCEGGGGARAGRVIAASSTSITVTGAGWWPTFGFVRIWKNVPWAIDPVSATIQFDPSTMWDPPPPPPSYPSEDDPRDPVPLPGQPPGDCTNGC
jgi:uncharacterized lipoprotein YbaY